MRMTRTAVAGSAVLALLWAGGGAPRAAQDATLWRLDSLASIGGHPVKVVGTPRIVGSGPEVAIEFNGTTDGLFIEANPIAGLERFTVEAVVEPAPDGPPEQRFIHIAETGTENRLMLETRILPGAAWSLDTFLRHGEASLTLLDRNVTHPAGRWHAVALTFDGRTMAHYVDGVRELGGEVAFKPLGPGRTSLGVRQNLVSWFKGKIRLVRVTPAVLSPEAMLKAEGAR